MITVSTHCFTEHVAIIIICKIIQMGLYRSNKSFLLPIYAVGVGFIVGDRVSDSGIPNVVQSVYWRQVELEKLLLCLHTKINDQKLM